MLLLLTDQAGLVPLPGLPSSLRGDLDEVSNRGQIRAELSGETGQSEHTELVWTESQLEFLPVEMFLDIQGAEAEIRSSISNRTLAAKVCWKPVGSFSG